MNKSNQSFSNLIDGQIGPDNIANLFLIKIKNCLTPSDMMMLV